MPLIAITGTPGTGKTSVSDELRRRGYRVIDIGAHMREHGLLGARDEDRDTFEVDLDMLNSSLEMYADSEETIFMESHLAHMLDCSLVVVLRCSPKVLASRLAERGYGRDKIAENVQAEILDVILCEAADSDIPVYEIDCTDAPVGESADVVVDIINGRGDDHLPGRTDWTGEMEEWF